MKKNQKIHRLFYREHRRDGRAYGRQFLCGAHADVPQDLQKKMQELSYRIVEAIGVVGGTNIQFAHNLKDDRLVAIEINPRTSRSSALASKAPVSPLPGFPRN